MLSEARRHRQLKLIKQRGRQQACGAIMYFLVCRRFFGFNYAVCGFQSALRNVLIKQRGLFVGVGSCFFPSGRYFGFADACSSSVSLSRLLSLFVGVTCL